MLQLAALLLLNDDPLIVIQKGELPIVISAPHGGRLPIPDCPLRTNKSLPQFVTVLDTNSDKLAEETAHELEMLTGKKPWLIVAKFSRKYVDANRPVEHGTESDSGKAVHRRYHDALRQAVDASRSEPGVLLLDFHSQGNTKDLIFRGTANLRSLKRDSLRDLIKPTGFLGELERAGLKFQPKAENAEEKEHPSFDGGWITRTYGASSDKGINAIQLEVGADYRSKTTVTDTARKIAQAIKSRVLKLPFKPSAWRDQSRSGIGRHY